MDRLMEGQIYDEWVNRWIMEERINGYIDKQTDTYTCTQIDGWMNK